MPDDLTPRINALPPEFEAVREWQHEGWRGRGDYDSAAITELLDALELRDEILRTRAERGT